MRSHPEMNVWECLWNIDECVMKQSRQTPSEHWGRKDRERESGYVLYVCVWMTFDLHLLRKLVHGQRYVDSCTVTSVIVTTRTPKCRLSNLAAGICSLSDAVRSNTNDGDQRSDSSQRWWMGMRPGPCGTIVFMELALCMRALSCWNRRGTNTNCWHY